MSNEKETMNTQERKEQEYSDIKVSKQTAKIFQALRKWSEFYSSLEAIEGISDSRFEDDFDKPLYKIRDELDGRLIDSIISQQPVDRPYTYEVI